MKAADLLFLAGGGALIWALWPKKSATALPAGAGGAPASSGTTSVRPGTSAGTSTTQPWGIGVGAEYADQLLAPEEELGWEAAPSATPSSGVSPGGPTWYTPGGQTGPTWYDGLDYGANLIDFPGDMRDAATQVDQQIRAVMIDVASKRASIPYDLAAAWDSFVNEWEHFTEQDQGPGQGWLYGSGVANWWSAGAVSMDAINQRAQTLIDWRNRLRGYFTLSSPEPQPPPGPTDPLGLSKISKAIPWIVAGIAAIYILPAVVKQLEAHKPARAAG